MIYDIQELIMSFLPTKSYNDLLLIKSFCDCSQCYKIEDFPKYHNLIRHRKRKFNKNMNSIFSQLIRDYKYLFSNNFDMLFHTVKPPHVVKEIEYKWVNGLRLVKINQYVESEVKPFFFDNVYGRHFYLR